MAGGSVGLYEVEGRSRLVLLGALGKKQRAHRKESVCTKALVVVLHRCDGADGSVLHEGQAWAQFIKAFGEPLGASHT